MIRGEEFSEQLCSRRDYNILQCPPLGSDRTTTIAAAAAASADSTLETETGRGGRRAETQEQIGPQYTPRHN